MQDELMDDMIRDAAAQYQPGFDEAAWKKMQQQLDLHLPQKKGRKRYGLLLLALLLITGGAISYAIWWRPAVRQNDSGTARQQTTTPGTNAPATTAADNTAAIPVSPGNTTPADIKRQDPAGNTAMANANTTVSTTATAPATVLATDDPTASPANPGTKYTRRRTGHTAKRRVTTSKAGIAVIPAETGTASDSTTNNISTPTDSNAESIAMPPATVPVAAKDSVGASPRSAIAATVKPADSTATTPLPKNTSSPTTRNRKKPKGFGNHFLLTATIGADLSYVRPSQPGGGALVYGAGIGYTIGKHWRIGAGLYVADKIYPAQPGDYHPPASFWTFYADLDRIAAVCRVHEIPVTAAYHFGIRPKHNWFAAVGLSSVFMKTEDYTYYYKLPNGQSRAKKWYYENEHKHFLSTLTLSGGYQYTLSKHLSFLAEPYLKVPLKGIGYGRIRLNSTGFVLTAAIRPFAK